MYLFIKGQLYAMQNGMEVDKKSKEARTFLFSLMDYLEKVFYKKELLEAFGYF